MVVNCKVPHLFPRKVNTSDSDMEDNTIPIDEPLEETKTEEKHQFGLLGLLQKEVKLLQA